MATPGRIISWRVCGFSNLRWPCIFNCHNLGYMGCWLVNHPPTLLSDSKCVFFNNVVLAGYIEAPGSLGGRGNEMCSDWCLWKCMTWITPPLVPVCQLNCLRLAVNTYFLNVLQFVCHVWKKTMPLIRVGHYMHIMGMMRTRYRVKFCIWWYGVIVVICFGFKGCIITLTWFDFLTFSEPDCYNWTISCTERS